MAILDAIMMMDRWDGIVLRSTNDAHAVGKACSDQALLVLPQPCIDPPFFPPSNKLSLVLPFPNSEP